MGLISNCALACVVLNTANCFLLRKISLNEALSAEKGINSYLTNHRFWSQTFNLNSSYQNHNVDIISEISSAMQLNGIDMTRVNFGAVIMPKLNRLIPIHDGVIQIQHSTRLDLNTNSSEITVCAFSPRATHVCTSPEEGERPTDPERLVALNNALLSLSTTSPEELLGARLAGTPPARIYRSFVAPRPKAVHILEPVERAANRTAQQIELALRQLRADEASYLRNTDRAAPMPSLDSDSTAPPSVHTPTHPVVLVLDNIRSAFNVGSMFRTAETAGAYEVITCGITAHPPHPKLRKTAFSSVDMVPTRHFEDTLTALQTLRAEGYTVCAMETTERSRIYTEVEYPRKLALVLGNEVTGVDTRVMEQAELLVQIPTYGLKNSLNVASAAPIVLFEVLRQWTSSIPSAAGANAGGS